MEDERTQGGTKPLPISNDLTALVFGDSGAEENMPKKEPTMGICLSSPWSRWSLSFLISDSACWMPFLITAARPPMNLSLLSMSAATPLMIPANCWAFSAVIGERS